MPILTLDRLTVVPGGSVTVTVANAPGGPKDWLALAPFGSEATSYLKTTYVGAGVSDRTWTVAVPGPVGAQYEVRLLLNDGYAIVARSATVTVADVPAAPTLTALDPATVGEGSGALGLTVRGSGLTADASLRVDGAARGPVTVVSATELRVTLPATDVAARGTRTITVATGAGTSNALPLTITPPPPPAPVPTVNGLAPAAATVGAAGLTLTVRGQDFVATSRVRVEGRDQPTTFVSAQELRVTLPASDLSTERSLGLTVFTPAPGGGTSGPLTLTVKKPTAPTLTLDRLTVAPGGSVTVTVANAPGGPKDWLALAPFGSEATSYLKTTYVGAGVSDRTWTVAVPGGVGGQFEIRLLLNDGYAIVARSATVTVADVPAAPALTALDPASVGEGSGALGLTVRGNGFTADASLRVDGAPRAPVTVVSATELRVTLPATDVAARGTRALTVATGAGTSNPLTLTVTPPLPPAPAPTLSGLTPAAATVGGGTLTLTVRGQDFVATSRVRVDGSDRPTTFVSAQELRVTLPAADLAAERNLSLTVFTPAPGGGTSGPLVLPVRKPVGPALSLDRTSVPVDGSVTVTVSGAPGGPKDWLALAPAGSPATSYLKTTYVGAGVSDRTWTVAVPGGVGAQYVIRLLLNDGYAIVAQSAVLTVTDVPPGPTLTALEPASVGEGSGPLALTVRGTAFDASAALKVDGAPRGPVTLVSATELRVTLPAPDLATRGTRQLTVTTTAGTSNALPLTITPPPPPAPVPTLTSLTPSTATLGAAGLTLTVRGADFVNSSHVRVDGSDRPTTFVSATELRVTLPAGDLAAERSLSITVLTPAPGGGTSAPLALPVRKPVGPALSLDRTSVPVGGSVTVTVSGAPGGAKDWLALAAFGSPATSYLKTTYVGAGVSDRTWSVAVPGPVGAQYELRLLLNDGYAIVARSATITVADVPAAPTLTALDPATVGEGSGALGLTVRGTAFTADASLRVDGAPRGPVTVVSSTELRVTLPATDLATRGTRQVTVATTAGVSTALALTVTPPPPPAPAPTLSGLTPAAATVGAGSLTLTVRGQDFVATSRVRVEGSDRPTTFVSAQELRVTLPAGDLSTERSLSLTVFTPAPGGGTSGPLPLPVKKPTTPTLTLDRTTVAPGGSVTVTVANAPGGPKDWLALAPADSPATSYLKTTYVGAGVSDRTWTVAVPGGVGAQYVIRLLLNDGYAIVAQSAVVTVADVPPGPTLTALEPNSVGEGSGALTLTVRGTAFDASAALKVDGAARGPVTMVSPTELRVTLPAGDVATRGTRQVTVTTTAGTSNALPLTVTPPPPPAPVPTLTSLTPSTATLGAAGLTLTVRGADFVNSSHVRVDGSDRPTTFVSATELRVTLPASDLSTERNLGLTVFTPAPGGGTSGPLALPVRKPVGPALSLDRTSVPVGGSVTVTVSGAPGGAKDWLALAAFDSPATSYLKTTYVGAGVSDRTWTVAVPGPVGAQYELRLLLNDGYAIVARSATITVVPGGGVAGTAPTISGLTFAPRSVPQWSGTVEVQASVTFVDPDGDVARLRLGDPLTGEFIDIPVSTTQTSGTILIQVSVDTSEAGEGPFTVQVLDKAGNASNVLRDTFMVF